MDPALSTVLLVNQDLGIPDPVAEVVRAESSTPSEAFNAAVAAGSEFNRWVQVLGDEKLITALLDRSNPAPTSAPFKNCSATVA